MDEEDTVSYLVILRPSTKKKKNGAPPRSLSMEKEEEIDPHKPYRYSKINAIFVWEACQRTPYAIT
jgi:hypothetical protein